VAGNIRICIAVAGTTGVIGNVRGGKAVALWPTSNAAGTLVRAVTPRTERFQAICFESPCLYKRNSLELLAQAVDRRALHIVHHVRADRESDVSGRLSYNAGGSS